MMHLLNTDLPLQTEIEEYLNEIDAELKFNEDSAYLALIIGKYKLSVKSAMKIINEWRDEHGTDEG